MNANGIKIELNPPRAGKNFLVQCKGFQCLAYRNHERKWVSTFGQEKLKDIVRVLPWQEPAMFVMPVISGPEQPQSSRIPIRFHDFGFTVKIGVTRKTRFRYAPTRQRSLRIKTSVLASY